MLKCYSGTVFFSLKAHLQTISYLTWDLLVVHRTTHHVAQCVQLHRSMVAASPNVCSTCQENSTQMRRSRAYGKLSPSQLLSTKMRRRATGRRCERKKLPSVAASRFSK